MSHAFWLIALAGVLCPPRTPPLVGQLIVTGNEMTPDRLYREWLGLYTGQRLTGADLRAAQRRLSVLAAWGIAAKVNVLDPGSKSEVKDIQVQVHETAFAYMVFWPRRQLYELFCEWELTGRLHHESGTPASRAAFGSIFRMASAAATAAKSAACWGVK